MADNRTMAQMLQAPIEGYEDAIVVPPINANNFKLKQPLINLVQRTDNQEKDEKQSQNDKTGLGMERTVKDKAKSKPESQSSQKVNRKVNWSKSKSTQVNPEAKRQRNTSLGTEI
ncbi:hypothetical protein Tco_0103651, partial [Tanacetum coccineum]